MSKSKDSTLLIIALAALLIGIVATSMYLNTNAKKQVDIDSEEVIEDDTYTVVEEDALPEPDDESELMDDAVEETTDEPIFTVVERMPEFPGGDEAMKRFVYGNFNFPTEAQEVGAEGKIFIEFIVDENGKMRDMKIAKDGVGFGCGEEALRVIKKLARNYTWTPGEQRGDKVRVKYRYPIIIKLK